MRLFRLVALVVLVLASTLAAADSIDFQGAGTLSSHTAFTKGKIAAGHHWEVGDELLQIDDLTTGKMQNGNLGIFDLTTGKLFSCSSGLCFHGGTLDIDNLANNDIFAHSLISGTISMSNGVTTLSAQLTNGAAAVLRLKGGQFSSQAAVHTGVIPEPATLSLLGTGLLGLGFMQLRRARA